MEITQINNIMQKMEFEKTKLENEKASVEKDIIIYTERQKQLKDILIAGYGTDNILELEKIEANLKEELKNLIGEIETMVKVAEVAQ